MMIFEMIDFAIKFLTKKYLEFIANWFRKAHMVMHVSSVILKDHMDKAKTGKSRFKKSLTCEVDKAPF